MCSLRTRTNLVEIAQEYLGEVRVGSVLRAFLKEKAPEIERQFREQVRAQNLPVRVRFQVFGGGDGAVTELPEDVKVALGKQGRKAVRALWAAFDAAVESEFRAWLLDRMEDDEEEDEDESDEEL